MEIISKRLKALRESVGLSQNKLAQISEIKQSSINRYENGSATPSPENMVKLADYYDVSLDYIYGRTDNPQGRLYEHKTKYSPEGIILESLLEGMAEYYSAELSVKVTRGHTENALKCKYNGGTLKCNLSQR